MGVLDPNKTQLSGSYVGTVETTDDAIRFAQVGRKTETGLARAVRTAGTASATLTVPAGVKGALVLHRVYAATGTFTAGEGAKLHTRNRIDGNHIVAGLDSDETTTVQHQAHFYEPGASAGDTASAGLSFVTHKFAPIALGVELQVQIIITGTFAGGEGVDSDVEVMWTW